MNNKIDKDIQRILVTLNIDYSVSPFLEPLVMLAAKLKAEISALSIENSELQQIAKLPFTREITFQTAHIRSLDSNLLARRLKQHTNTWREMLQNLTRLSNVACSFLSTEGPYIESILSEFSDFEIIVLFPERYKLLTNRTSAELDELINPTIVACNDATQTGKSARIVQVLAETGHLHKVSVLTRDNTEKLARELFTFDDIEINFQPVDSFDIPRIAPLLDPKNPGLLILPFDDRLISQSKQIKDLLDYYNRILILVR